MARVLLAWEFGEDLGHIRNMIPIAHELRAMGHDPCFAFRDATRLDEVVHAGFEGFPAPALRPPRTVNPAPLTFSDILLNLGYENGDALAGALRAWGDLLALLRPQVLVCDYAPTALIAARRARIPRATLGTGFWMPPSFDPLPALRPWIDIPIAQREALDARIAQAVARATGSTDLATMRELFEADAELLCTFEELDTFGPRPAVYEGPVTDDQGGLPVAWATLARPRVFAYLKPRDSHFEAILRALRALPGEAIVAAPGLEPSLAAAASGPALRVFAQSVAIGALLESADLCVLHAGPGTAGRALLAGVPMALFPMHLEQFLVARRLVEAGVAVMVAPEDPVIDYGPWLAQALGRADLRAQSRAHAAKRKGFSMDAARRRVARRIADLAAG
jgi:UDP:flavonoid glycosyltransferase YjiC (YdhE family)